MSISNRDRFLAITRFERPGDLCMLTPVRNSFWAETLREWVKQGAPEQILDSRFRTDYFQFQHIHWLAEIRSGWFGAEMLDKTDIGYGIVVSEAGIVAGD